MTPEQQADYDYAMSQLKPKHNVGDIVCNLNINAEKFNAAFMASSEAMRAYSKSIAKIAAGLGIPKAIMFAPNCRCVITEKPNGSQKE